MINMKKTLSAEQVSIYDQYLIIDEVLIQTTILFQELKIWALIRFCQSEAIKPTYMYLFR